MRKPVFLLIVYSLLFLVNYSFGQLIISSVVKNKTDANNLVNKVLKGNGVAISNVVYEGMYNITYKGRDTIISGQIGQFSTGSNPTNLGITGGIIMSTGDIQDAKLPNDTARKQTCWQCVCENIHGYDSSSYCQDREISLEILQGCSYCSYDAAMLQFDFTPSSSPISFKYVFASDEYPRWVCSDYNDKFAFFITSLSNDGLGYHYKNLALIPGTKLPVEINTVNDGHAGSGEDSTHCKSRKYSKYFIDNSKGKTIKYMGFTTVFTAEVDVIPCMNYRMRLAIADINDPFVDSSVFLQAGSLSSSSFAKVTYQHPDLDSTEILRDCNDGIVTFHLPKNVIKDSIIHFRLKGGKYNFDYTTIPAFTDTLDSIGVKAGQSIALFTIHAPRGGTATSLNLIVYSGCSQAPPVVINIKEVPLVKATPGADTSICKGANAIISVKATGGFGRYTYSWKSKPTGFTSGSASQYVSPKDTTIYTAIVTDGCSTDSAAIKVDVFNAYIKGSELLCKGSNITLNANLGNGIKYQWFQNGDSIKGATGNTYTTGKSGKYSVIETSGVLKCPQKSDTITVIEVPVPDSYFTPKTKDTAIAENKSVVLTAATGKGYTYQWLKNNSNISGATESTYTANSTGTYAVMITDSNKCSDISDTIDVKVIPPFINKIPNVMIPGKQDCNSYFMIEGGLLGNVEVHIFNRWGERIFDYTYNFTSQNNDALCPNLSSQNTTSDTHYYKLWDGTNNSGNKMAAGAYFFVIKAYGIDGKPVTPKVGKLNGTITVLNE